MAEQSFLGALYNRYLDDSIDELDSLAIKQKYRKNDLVVELVGKEKVLHTFKQLQSLRQIVLNHFNINSATKESEFDEFNNILNSLKKVESLDLSYNNISSWSELAKIVGELPLLNQLIISANPIKSYNIQEISFLKSSFINIKHLVIGCSNLDWTSAKLLNDIFINLESLDLFSNNIDKITGCTSKLFTKLKSLSLDNNPIQSWDEICALNTLFSLENLKCQNCAITTLNTSKMTEEFRGFLKLKVINLNYNLLNDWIDVTLLNKFSNLNGLVIKNNPLFKGMCPDVYFNEIIGLVGSIKMLDKENISYRRRKDAEIYYLKKHFKDWHEKKEGFNRIHTRFNSIVEMYGKPLEVLESAKDKIAKMLINVNLKFKDKIIPLKLNKITDINFVKILMINLFKMENISVFDLKLVWESPTIKGYIYEMDQNDKSLDFYDVEDNSIVEGFIV